MPVAVLAVSVLIAVLLVYLVIRTVRDGGSRNGLIAENARLEADLRNERQNAEERIAFLENSEKRLRTEFENIAGRLFEEIKLLQ